MPDYLNIWQAMIKQAEITTAGGARPAIALNDVTEDEFHRGVFTVLQPAATGHRSGSDALLIAASLPEAATGDLADLGAGSGVAGLAAVSMNPGLKATLVEKNPHMADLARRTARLRPNQRISARVSVLEADVTLTGGKREAAGLAPYSFDYVIMNPPYNHAGHRASSDMLKAEAHVMAMFGLDAWMRTAAAILKNGGLLAMIYRTERIADVIAAAQGRFGAMTIVPVHSRDHEPAKRILVRMTKGSRAPLSIMPGIVLHDGDGAPSRLADALMNGEARVDYG